MATTGWHAMVLAGVVAVGASIAAAGSGKPAA